MVPAPFKLFSSGKASAPRVPPSSRAFALSSLALVRRRSNRAALLARSLFGYCRIASHGTTTHPPRLHEPTTLGRLLTTLGRLLTTLWRLLMRSAGSTNFLLRKHVQMRSVHTQTRSVHVQTRSGHSLRIARPPSKPPMLLDSRTRRTPAIVTSIRTPIVSRTSRISPPNMSPVLFLTANVQRFDHIGPRKRPRRRGRRQRRASPLRNAGCSRSSVSGGEGRSRRQTQPSSFFSLNDASMRAREPLTWSIGLALLRAGVARTS